MSIKQRRLNGALGDNLRRWQHSEIYLKHRDLVRITVRGRRGMAGVVCWNVTDE